MKEESLKHRSNEDMFNVWLYRFQTKRISTPWIGITKHVVSCSGSVCDGLRCNRWIESNDLLRKRHLLLLTRTESHKKDLTRPRVKWRKASESAHPTNVLESIVLLLSLLNVLLNYMFGVFYVSSPCQKVEPPAVDTCPENTKHNISSSLRRACSASMVDAVLGGQKCQTCWELMWVDMLMVNSTIIQATIRANRLPTFCRRLTAGAIDSISDSGKPETDMSFGFNKRPVMMMEMPVNISGPTKVDVGGNDREESPTIGTVAPSSSKVVKKARIA
ncbi:hypothetical protein F2Q69_00037103 [Brassica cretica]|uniref:Uncharacterized protein n=1 Tax=Brassica cretica TaxID=69181 RepID=A0A8S9SSE6_BRACR|nr:hypothetical protein F2Q69_00037103 [Brassica cretica]